MGNVVDVNNDDIVITLRVRKRTRGADRHSCHVNIVVVTLRTRKMMGVDGHCSCINIIIIVDVDEMVSVWCWCCHIVDK